MEKRRRVEIRIYRCRTIFILRDKSDLPVVSQPSRLDSSLPALADSSEIRDCEANPTDQAAFSRLLEIFKMPKGKRQERAGRRRS